MNNLEAHIPGRAIILPNLTLPAEKETGYIWVWRQRRLIYLKHHRKVLYCNLLTSGKLHSHIADTEEQAQQLFSRLVKQYAENESVTEELKATDMLLWVRKMNNICNRAMEIVNEETVFVLITYSKNLLVSEVTKSSILLNSYLEQAISSLSSR